MLVIGRQVGDVFYVGTGIRVSLLAFGEDWIWLEFRLAPSADRPARKLRACAVEGCWIELIEFQVTIKFCGRGHDPGGSRNIVRIGVDAPPELKITRGTPPAPPLRLTGGP
jgi:sRNA-binding carbon storage regulator CsrA